MLLAAPGPTAVHASVEMVHATPENQPVFSTVVREKSKIKNDCQARSQKFSLTKLLNRFHTHAIESIDSTVIMELLRNSAQNLNKQESND